jgi:nucleoside-diphosphate-sugar epimerase
MAQYLVTGVAVFIVSKVTEFLLAQGDSVLGVDNLNKAYDVRLTDWRLAQLAGQPGFEFHRLDIAHKDQLEALWQARSFDAVINLAAGAGVR